MRPSSARAVLLALFLTACATSVSHAESHVPFYKGKRLTILINFAVAGPTDIEGRLMAKYLARHIDGNPMIIVQNKDGASGLVGATYLGEIGPRDGTMLGYLTGATWESVIEPEAFHTDFKSYEFIGYAPTNAFYYVRTDTPPGMKVPADIVKAQGLIVGGLAAASSKDLRLRLTFDMLGVPYRYVTGYRSSSTARLAVQSGEISVHSETTPAFFGVIEPTLVKTGKFMPIFYDQNFDGATFLHDMMVPTEVPTFLELYKQIKGELPSGQLFEAYKTNLQVDYMQRLLAMPPGTPPAAVAALRKAVLALNDDPDYAADAMKTVQFVPHYQAGPNVEDEVKKTLTIAPGMRDFIMTYIKKVAP